MTKPSDIPQDVWDKAMSFLEAAPMVSIPCASDDRCHLINDPQTAIARAILAAKAEERRELQTSVQDMVTPVDTSNSWQLGYRQCRLDVVAAIRKRGEG